MADDEKMPAGLLFSERRLWEECPQARRVLLRLASYRDVMAVIREELEEIRQEIRERRECA